MSTVFVVMSNDFPDAVFSDEPKAEAYCKKRMDFQREGLKPYETPRIYYRVYDFEVDKDGSPLSLEHGRRVQA